MDDPLSVAPRRHSATTVMNTGAKSASNHEGRVDIHDDGQGVRVVWLEPVFVSVFYGKPTVAALDFLVSIQSKAIGSEGPFANITILSPSLGLEMPADARKRAQEIQNETSDRRVANVSLLLGTGFFAAIARNIIAGVQMLAPALPVAGHQRPRRGDHIRHYGDERPRVHHRPPAPRGGAHVTHQGSLDILMTPAPPLLLVSAGR